MCHTVSPKRKFTLLSSRVLKTEGGQIKSRRCAKPTIELVQTEPSLIFKFQTRLGPVWDFPKGFEWSYISVGQVEPKILIPKKIQNQFLGWVVLPNPAHIGNKSVHYFSPFLHQLGLLGQCIGDVYQKHGHFNLFCFTCHNISWYFYVHPRNLSKFMYKNHTLHSFPRNVFIF